MAEQIICDRVWMDDYLNQLKQCRNYAGLMKESLFRVKESILPEQYMSVMREIEKIEHNFQAMYNAADKFVNDTQINASELNGFAEEELFSF